MLYLDLETYSSTSIKHGTHAYAADAKIMLIAWAIDDGEVCVTDLTETARPPRELWRALTDPACPVVIHNSHFDRTVLQHAVGVRIDTSRITDTMVQALSHGLPGSLAQLCEILRLDSDQAKDKAGKKLINLFCKPLGKNRKLDRATRLTHPEEWAQFKAYAANDIVAMRAVHKILPTYNNIPAEQALWQLDQRINDRGMAIDMGLVDAAIKAIGLTKVDLAAQASEMTEGRVASTTQAEVLRLAIFEQFGIDMPNLRMATVAKTIEDESTPAELVDLLNVRLQASSTSTSKYTVLRHGTSADGRLRGVLQFNGATRTGRWAGRLFQPQNLPRPTLKNDKILEGIGWLKEGCAHLLTDNVMELVSSAVRGVIVAPEGKKLVVADLANIEGRVQAWLANEEWKLAAFSEYDAGTGPDLYKLAYSKSFGIDAADVTDEQRQVGKVMELALAYQGGVSAFVTFAAAYNIKLADMADRVLGLAPMGTIKEADAFLTWTEKEKRPTFGLSPEAFVACDVLKRVWREAHPQISGYWKKLQASVINAINRPGRVLRVLRLEILADEDWLTIVMPSGRTLVYPDPRVNDNTISFMGTDQFTRKWVRITTHGGKLFENLCQAIARDVMAGNMRMVDESGYEIVLHVHDELITEAIDAPAYNAKGLSQLLAATPDWAPDMPLAAAGFETYRYRKG